jgi:hypothetical protein
VVVCAVVCAFLSRAFQAGTEVLLGSKTHPQGNGVFTPAHSPSVQLKQPQKQITIERTATGYHPEQRQGRCRIEML